MGSLLGIDTSGVDNSYDGNSNMPNIRTQGGINNNPQVIAVRDKLNNHMAEMSNYVAQGIEQGVRRLKALPQPDLTNHTNGNVAQQNYLDRLNRLP
jgi:hypothetical protein